MTLTKIEIAVCLALAAVIGAVSLVDLRATAVVAAAIVYGILLFRNPEMALLVAFLMIMSCFSIMDEDFLRMPRLFRLRDLFLVSAFVPLLIGLYRRDTRMRYIFSSPLAKAIYAVIALAFIQILVTKARFPGETIGSIVRMGRKYFYYALYFPALYILIDPKRLKRFMIVFVGMVTVYSGLYILQFLIGPGNKIFMHGRVEHQILQGFGVTRVYTFGMTTATLLFHISFMVLLFSKKWKGQSIGLLVLTGVQNLVTFGRAHIFGIITGTLFGISLIRGHLKIKSVIKLVAIILVILAVGQIISTFIYGGEHNLIQAIVTRLMSMYDAIRYQHDAFGDRIQDSLGRMSLIRDNLLFGIGFIHNESALFAFARGYEDSISTTDSGTITLLLNFGVIGIIWLLILAFLVLRAGMETYRKTEDDFLRAVSVGILAFFFGRVFAFITLADFVMYDEIVVIILVMALLEALRYRTIKT